MSASVVYRLDDFPELKQKIDRAVSNIELYGSDRYDHMKQVILKHETKFLKRVNALADRDPISGRLSVRNDPNVIRLKERYSQKIHILQESLNRFRTLDTHLKNSGTPLPPNPHRRDPSPKLHIPAPPNRPPPPHRLHHLRNLPLHRLPPPLPKIRFRHSSLLLRHPLRDRSLGIRQALFNHQLYFPQKLTSLVHRLSPLLLKGRIWQDLL